MKFAKTIFLIQPYSPYSLYRTTSIVLTLHYCTILHCTTSSFVYS